MTSTPRESRHWSRRLVFLLVLVAPLVFSAALATPVQPDGESEVEKDADPFLRYLKRYISKMGSIFGEDTSANLLPLSTSTLDDDGEEDTVLAPLREDKTRHQEDEEFTPIDRILEFLEGTENESKETTPKPSPSDGNDKPKQLDPWSLVWYIGSFGGLVAFFLAVSCSECCCHKPAGGQGGAAPAGAGLDEPPRLPAVAEGPPPPPYSMFAPPPYDSLCYGVTDEKDKLEVFVVPVPVHGAAQQPAPADHSQPP